LTTLFINIKQLLGATEEVALLRGDSLKNLPCIPHGFLLIEDGIIAAYGHMTDLETLLPNLPPVVVDVAGQFVMPAWCDSHTHLVFAQSRESEFVDKINGASYAEIAAKGGGILNSANTLQQTSEEELYNSAFKRLKEVAAMGTGAIEIKSGYGLTVDAEMKMLRVIKKLKQQTDLVIKSTFLGAHAIPAMYKNNREEYIKLITEEMLPAIAAEKLADYIDVFCEEGFFSVTEMETICNAGKQFGLRPKLHVNQLNSIGGVQSAIRMGALSIDHLEVMSDEDVHDLASAETIGTLLPSAAFFLRMPYQPARKMIDAGAAIAIASDFNPGSSPSGNMSFVVALSCIQMRMLPGEAINAATINGAFAMGVEKEVGTITVGKVANLIFTKPMSSLAYLPYSFGSSLIDKVMIRGNFLS
jgi:imidazolonepropionase